MLILNSKTEITTIINLDLQRVQSTAGAVLVRTIASSGSNI